MNWKENRAQQRKIKEIEREEEIRLQKKEKEQLNKEFQLIYDQSKSIINLLFPEIKSQSTLKHPAFKLIRSRATFTTSDKINYFVGDKLNEDNIDALFKNSSIKVGKYIKSGDLNIVAFVYLFWKIFTPNSIQRNKHSQIIDLYYEQSNLNYDSKILNNRFKNDIFNTHGFQLNSQLKETIYSLGLFREKRHNYAFNTQIYEWVFKKVIKSADNLKKIKEQNYKLRNNYHLMYLLSNFYKDFKNDFENSSEKFQIIKNDILIEEKKFNRRIKFLNNLPSIEELDKELGPQRLNSWRINGQKINDLDNLDDWEITELIILDALSQVKGNPAPDFDPNDLVQEKTRTNKEKKSGYSSSSPRTYYSTSFDRNMTKSEIEQDHIYIDGVGWMHEDEVGTDR